MNTTVCERGPGSGSSTSNTSCAGAAGSKASLPAWSASIVQLPAPIVRTFGPASVQTAGVRLETATASPEVARASSR